MTSVRYALLVIVSSLSLASLIHCTSSTEPRDTTHVCDREKRAVWAAWGHESEPPATLMAWGEWTLPGSTRPPVQSETFYFMPQHDGSCRVMRA